MDGRNVVATCGGLAAGWRQGLQALLATTNFAAFGFRVVQADEGRTRLYVPARASHLRPGEIVAGYVLVAAADVAVWLAIKTMLGVDDRSVTIDLHTSFLAAAASELRRADRPRRTAHRYRRSDLVGCRPGSGGAHGFVCSARTNG